MKETTQTKPVRELVLEIRDSKRTPLAIKRGGDQPHWRVQSNLIWIVVGLLEDSPLQVRWVASLPPLCLPCHDHNLEAA